MAEVADDSVVSDDVEAISACDSGSSGAGVADRPVNVVEADRAFAIGARLR